MNGSNREIWVKYLEETPTYGTYTDRRPEYALVHGILHRMGLEDGDLIVDVGAGTCDFDRYLRTEGNWHGRYWPIDGAIQGIDFMLSDPDEYLPSGTVDWFVSIETIEHVTKGRSIRLLNGMMDRAGKGVVITTPNAEAVDVLAVDPTHLCGWTTSELEAMFLTVSTATFSPDRPQPDTLVGWYKP